MREKSARIVGPEDYGFTGPTGSPEHVGGGQYGLQRVFDDALVAASKAMTSAGLGGVKVTDGFRDYASQVATKQKAEADGHPELAAEPGRSVHGVGLAADLELTPKQVEWLRNNGAGYGLFPGSGLRNEPWHWQLLPQKWNANKKDGFEYTPIVSEER